MTLRSGLIALLTFSLFSVPMSAKEVKTQRIPIKLDQTLKIQYSKESWNLEPSKIDSANIILRDKNTGRLIMVRLQESAPDSQSFFGFFAIGWQDQSDFVPLVYVPPKSVTSESEVRQLIESGKIDRKPYVLYTGENDQQTLSVFDKKEEAIEFFTAYKQSKKVKEEEAKPQPTPVPDESLREAQRLAALEAAKKKLEEEAKKRELERIRLKQEAERKAREARERAAQLAAAEKKERQAKAKKFAADATAAYRAGKFKEAEGLYAKAVEFDPENDTFYYQYGATLYRNQKHNDSLVYLRLSRVEGQLLHEKNFFMALNYYRLKEFKSSEKFFDEAAKAGDKNIAPSSHFYKGLIQYSMERFNESRDSFQMVLDTSQDPKMDRQAEEYIERIAGILKFRELQKKPFSVIFMLTPQYDSNVLQVDASGGTLGANTNKASMRTEGFLSFAYRPIFTANHELNISLGGTTTATSDSNLTDTDSTTSLVSIPYKYRGTLGGGSWQLGVAANYSDTAVAGDPYLTSTGVTIDTTHVPGQNWAHVVALTGTSDGAKGTFTTDEEYLDPSASKMALTYTASNFLDRKKTTAVSYKLGYTSNAATGKNNSFTRIDLGVGYSRPVFWESSFNGALDYYTSSYSEYSEDGTNFDVRTDGNITLSLALNKPFKDWLIGTSSLTYTTNSSTVDSLTYDKYVLKVGVIMTPRF